MRKLLGLLMLALLIGCSNLSYEDAIEQTLDDIESFNLKSSTKYRKNLMTYYLPQDIGVLESNNISSRLSYGTNEIFMSIHVSDVLQKGEMSHALKLQDSSESKSIEYSKNFYLMNHNNEELVGEVLLEKLPASKYLLYVNVDDVFFVSSLYEADIKDVFERILGIAQSMIVDEKAVVSEFSNKESLSYEKNVIELFTESIPTEGMIKDIITNDEEND